MIMFFICFFFFSESLPVDSGLWRVFLVWVWFGFANNFIYFYAVLISRVFFVVVVNLHHTLLDPRGESADL